MVQLYFEHHDPWMPFVHRFSFDKEGVSWVLILAVASVGCQYSNVEGSELYILGLQDLLQKALPKDVSRYNFSICFSLTDSLGHGNYLF